MVRATVNVSSQQFYCGSLVEAVAMTLRETGLESKWLELELTESLAFDNSVATLRIMRDMKRIGVSLCLDDFGTGWSSFSYLRSFPLDRIKIDRSFMREVTSEPAAEAVVSGILDLGHKLGFDCVAEGVETRRQSDYLRRHKCAEVQGFLYSPALPGAECGAQLRSGKLEPISLNDAPGDFVLRQKPLIKVVS